MENLIETTFNVFIFFAVAGVALWLSWNVLEVIYRVTVIAVCLVCLAALTVWDWGSFLVKWILVKPIFGAYRILTR